MKVLQTTLAAVLLATAVSFSNQAEANTIEPTKKQNVAIVKSTASTYKLVYLKSAPGKVKINILNDKNEIIYTQKVKNVEGFAQDFNFTTLPKGEYTFEIIHPDGLRETKHVSYLDVTSKGMFKADVLDIDEQGKYRLAVIKNDGRPVNITVYNHENEIIHEETVKVDGGFRRVYDLGSLSASSDYKFVVTDDAHSLELFTQ